jgi:hypothetical protein
MRIGDDELDAAQAVPGELSEEGRGGSVGATAFRAGMQALGSISFSEVSGVHRFLRTRL